MTGPGGCLAFVCIVLAVKTATASAFESVAPVPVPAEALTPSYAPALGREYSKKGAKEPMAPDILIEPDKVDKKEINTTLIQRPAASPEVEEVQKQALGPDLGKPEVNVTANVTGIAPNTSDTAPVQVGPESGPCSNKTLIKQNNCHSCDAKFLKDNGTVPHETCQLMLLSQRLPNLWAKIVGYVFTGVAGFLLALFTLVASIRKPKVLKEAASDAKTNESPEQPTPLTEIITEANPRDEPLPSAPSASPFSIAALKKRYESQAYQADNETTQSSNIPSQANASPQRPDSPMPFTNQTHLPQVPYPARVGQQTNSLRHTVTPSPFSGQHVQASRHPEGRQRKHGHPTMTLARRFSSGELAQLEAEDGNFLISTHVDKLRSGVSADNEARNDDGPLPTVGEDNVLNASALKSHAGMKKNMSQLSLRLVDYLPYSQESRTNMKKSLSQGSLGKKCKSTSSLQDLNPEDDSDRRRSLSGALPDQE